MKKARRPVAGGPDRPRGTGANGAVPRGASSREAELEALAEAWPRILVAAGEGERLARWWLAERRRSIESGRAPFPRVPVDAGLLEYLFEIRRARRLVRGFEAIVEALAAQEAGLRRAPATRVAAARRISRLLLLTSDGSDRFYRNSEGLRDQYKNRLEVLVIDCDEAALGKALFGEGQRVRAVLIDHKEAVIELLARVALGSTAEPAESAGQPPVTGEAGGGGMPDPEPGPSPGRRRATRQNGIP